MNVRDQLAAAYHEHMSVVGYCAHYTSEPWMECEHEAAHFLATPSGQALVARVAALEAVAVKASHMGGCSQTHHDYVIAAARAALEGVEP
jgi:hypothetical protein